MPMIPFPVRKEEDLDAVRALFRDYAASLPVDLAFQGFAAELAGLPGRYAPPAGELLLARDAAGRAVGCVAIRPIDLPEACEVKRLYVDDAARGTGTGRALALAALAFASAAGYRRVLLDTLPSMAAAAALYRALGFEEIPAYGPVTLPGMLFFEKRL